MFDMGAAIAIQRVDGWVYPKVDTSGPEGRYSTFILVERRGDLKYILESGPSEETAPEFEFRRTCVKPQNGHIEFYEFCDAEGNNEFDNE